MDLFLSILPSLGIGGIFLAFLNRYFARADKREAERVAAKQAEDKEIRDLVREVSKGMNTIRLLSYARMSEETERLLNKGYATPAERRVLDEMYLDYKAHGWNGDMDERLKKVYAMRTDHAPK